LQESVDTSEETEWRQLQESVYTSEETECPWFDAESQPRVLEYTPTTPPPPPPSGREEIVDQRENVTHEKATEETLTNLVSFTLSGFDEVTDATFSDAKEACASGLAQAFRIDEEICNVSMHVTAGCDIRVGIAIPSSYARNSPAPAHIGDIETHILVEFFQKNYRKVKVSIDEKDVSAVQNEPLRRSCTTTTTTELGNESTSDDSNAIMLSTLPAMILLHLWL